MYPELRKVLQHITSKIEHHKLDTNYSLLSQAYEKVLTTPSSENDTEIARLEKMLTEAQTDIEPQNFTNKELNIFTSFDTEQVLGLRALESVRERTAVLTNNPHGVSQVYADVAGEITVLNKRATSLLSNMSDLWGEEKPQDGKKTQIDINFDGGVAIENLHSLREQSNEWVKIVDFAQKMLKKSTEDPIIISAGKASPFDISLYGDPILLGLIFFNFHKVIDIVKKILEIVQEVQKIRTLEIDKKLKQTALDALEESKEKALAEQIDKVLKEVFKQMSAHLNNTEEAKTSGRFLIEHVYNFANNEGTVTINNPTIIREKTGLQEEDVKPFDGVKEIAELRKTLANPKLPNALIDLQKEEEFLQKTEEKTTKTPSTPKRKYKKRKVQKVGQPVAVITPKQPENTEAPKVEEV